MNQFFASLIGGLTIAGTLALISLGLVLIYRATDTFNFAHGELMLIPAFIVGRWQSESKFPFVVNVVSSLLIIGAVGAVIYLLVMRKTVGLPAFMAVVATLGIASILDGVIALVFGANQYSITIPHLSTSTVSIFTVNVTIETVVLTVFSFVLVAAVALFMKYSEVGARVRAAGQDAILASHSGINVGLCFLGSWVAAAILAGVAGITYGSVNVVTTSITGLALLAFPAILLGGLDSIFGAIVGSVIVGLVQGFTAGYLGGELVNVTTYALLLAVLMVRPRGLFGSKVVVKL
jgi:branched-chain amino acid transport system permease protein